MADALLSLARAGSLAGDIDRARRHRAVAAAVARQLKHNLIDRVVEAAGLSIANWSYELVNDAGTFKPGRVEDTNHASYVLEFLDAATRDEPRIETGWLKPDLISRLGAAFEQAIVRKPDGSAATELYIKAAALPLNAREKQRAREFAFEASAEYPRGVVSLWRELSGEPRTLDLGLSIRTSWGWTRALRHRPDLLAILGSYLADIGDRDLSRNLFLAQAVFFRESAAFSGSPRASAAH